jgi:hypothetical protein
MKRKGKAGEGKRQKVKGKSQAGTILIKTA